MAQRTEGPQIPRIPNPARRAAFARGLSAESRAAALLIVKGYRIAARRWKSPVGEIDIVARRRNVLVFVEVKARVGHDEAALAITPRQRRRIVSAAQAWLVRHPDDATCAIRFDAVLVAPWRLPRHMVGAFDEDGR
jgi:putative endonuclease